MPNEQYSAVRNDEDEVHIEKKSDVRDIVKTVLFLTIIPLVCLIVGFAVGQNWKDVTKSKSWPQPENSLLPPQTLIPESTISPLVNFRIELT